jgi:hypothetical protein
MHCESCLNLIKGSSGKCVLFLTAEDAKHAEEKINMILDELTEIIFGLLIHFNEILLKDGLKRLVNKYNNNERVQSEISQRPWRSRRSGTHYRMIHYYLLKYNIFIEYRNEIV